MVSPCALCTSRDVRRDDTARGAGSHRSRRLESCAGAAGDRDCQNQRSRTTHFPRVRSLNPACVRHRKLQVFAPQARRARRRRRSAVFPAPLNCSVRATATALETATATCNFHPLSRVALPPVLFPIQQLKLLTGSLLLLLSRLLLPKPLPLLLRSQSMAQGKLHFSAVSVRAALAARNQQFALRSRKNQ